MKKFIFFIFFIVFFSLNLSANTISLNGTWQLSFWKQGREPVVSPAGMKKRDFQTISARVPGNVELDLFAAGLIADPMIGANIYALRQYEGYQWCYSKSFTSPIINDQQRVELFFGGIDCLAEIWLNGKRVGSAENMLIEHTFDITDYLKKRGNNKLQVIFRSVVIESQKYINGSHNIRNDASAEFEFIRKAPHTFGWNIMPRLVSAGLWRDVELCILEPIGFENTFWMTTNVNVKKQIADVCVDFQLKIPFEKLSGGLKIDFSIIRNGKLIEHRRQPLNCHVGREFFHIQDAELWWPRGYGEAALYDTEIKIIDFNNNVLACDSKKLGIRTVKLHHSEITTPRGEGHFYFTVNGEKIFIKGTNWVPVDALHSRDKSLMPEILEMLVELNCNMVRCWGGNVYEDDSFYDFCDQNGILVWQDFAMACTFYPQDIEFSKRIENEVRAVVIKLRNHPSLALWSGNNEDDSSLTWALGSFNINPNKDVISRGVIPCVIYEFDPTRSYLPSSPYYSEQAYELGNDVNYDYLPENHIWTFAYYRDASYVKSSAHFVSEIGFHGCPSRLSLERMLDKEFVYPWKDNYNWNEQWLAKSTRIFPNSSGADWRNNIMINEVKNIFKEVPKNLDSFIVASQIAQGESLKYIMELWRSRKFDKSGIIWWNRPHKHYRPNI